MGERSKDHHSKDQRSKVMAAANFFFKVPEPRLTLTYLFAGGLVWGIIARLAYGSSSIAEWLVFGGAEGGLLLALPALLSALVATTWFSRKQFKQDFKYYLFLSSCTAGLTGALYLIGLVLSKYAGLLDIVSFVLLANALVFLAWFASAFVGLNAGKRAAIAALFQPFFNIAFLFLWNKWALVENSFSIGSSPLLAFFKIIIASSILLVALWSLFYVINAPAKRNFGVSIIESFTLFLAQWIKGSKGLEDVFDDLSEEVNTSVGVVSFKNKHGDLEAVFVAPGVHFGPFGSLCSSEYPALVSKALEEKYGNKNGTHCKAFVFHTLVNHDFNVVYSSDFHKIVDAVEQGMRSKQNSNSVSFATSTHKNSNIFALAFNNNAFITLSRAPESTEDFSYSLGLALKNLCLTKFDEAIVVDRHNSLTDGQLVKTGSREYFEYEQAVKALKPSVQKPLNAGFASRSLKQFTARQGIGEMGLRVAVFDSGERKACFVLIDANNAQPEFRDSVVTALNKKYGFEFVDVFTSDTHSVNAINGINNPVGAFTDNHALLKEIEAGVEQALRDVKPVQASIASIPIIMRVLGSQRQSEFISTMNSIIAVTKILAPVILIASLLAVIAVLLFLK